MAMAIKINIPAIHVQHIPNVEDTSCIFSCFEFGGVAFKWWNIFRDALESLKPILVAFPSQWRNRDWIDFNRIMWFYLLYYKFIKDVMTWKRFRDYWPLANVVLYVNHKPYVQWNMSVTTTSIIKFITCDLLSKVL